MAIKAADVKKLRDMTGVAMMDCKKALVESDGDIEKAVDLLRTRGQAKAAKRAGKATSEGIVVTVVEGNKACNLEANCETDFVARNDDFLALAKLAASAAIESNPSDLDGLLSLSPNGKPLADQVTEATGSIGEKIQIRRFDVFEAEGGFVQDYSHMGGRIGVMVEVKGDDGSTEEVRDLARDVAMQVAAMRPQFLDEDEIPDDVRSRELEVQKQRVKEEGKPENMLEKIATGRMRKFYSEVCLLHQAFVKENKKSVKQYVDEVGKKLGKDLAVTRFSRFEVGEGMEAAAED